MACIHAHIVRLLAREDEVHEDGAVHVLLRTPTRPTGFSPKCRSEKTVILNVPSSLNVTRGLVGYGSRLTCASAIARSGRRIINDTAKFAEERGAYDLSNFQTVYHSPTSLQFRTGEPSEHPVAWTTWQQQAASTARVLLFIAPADRYLNEPARNARSIVSHERPRARP